MLDDLVLSEPLTFEGKNVTLKSIIADYVEDKSFKKLHHDFTEMAKAQLLLEDIDVQMKAFQLVFDGAMTKDDRDGRERSARSKELAFDELQVQHIETRLVNGKPAVDLWAHSDEGLFVENLKADQITVHEAVNIEPYNKILQEALTKVGDQAIDYPIESEELSVDHLQVQKKINDNDIQAISAALEQMTRQSEEIVVDHVRVNNIQGLVNGKDFG